LIASALSQRRIVEAEIEAVTPRRTASAARSLLDQRDKATPVSAGRVQASCLTSATWTGVKLGGRPDRRRSLSPANRSWANRRRHLRTVSTCSPVSTAIAALLVCWAAASTIRARSTSRCSARAEQVSLVSLACSMSVKMIVNGEVIMDRVLPDPHRDR